VFVRHALPGERVRVQVTEERASYLRADAVEVVHASAARVRPPCRYAGPGRCGGCDWQHVALDEQRSLKAAVVREQLQRMAGVARDVRVEAVEGDRDGLGWRTRVRFAVDAAGRPGLRRHRSHEVEPIDDCLIAHPLVGAAAVLTRRWPGHDAVDVEVDDDGNRVVRADTGAPDAEATLRHRVGDRWFSVPAGGFWQVHPGAASVLAHAVARAAAVRHGERCVDLYAGVGLFAAGLSDAAGSGQVVAVEADPRAAAAAARNVAGIEVVTARVERWLARHTAPADVVVLDPPRRGAGGDVVRAIAACRPRVVVYVACDPASLARDVATFADCGFRLDDVRAFDIFPMTAHVECVATLRAA
jgi:tRNA/tmRNA/rRNA uracil-C5-methylase (TrmA/RlmC/RlmD family)